MAGVGLGWRTDWLALVKSPLDHFTIHLPSRVPGRLGDEPGLGTEQSSTEVEVEINMKNRLLPLKGTSTESPV